MGGTRVIPKPESVASSGGITDLSTGATGTLPVSNGGTGKTSITANSYIKGNGTSAVTERTPTEVKTDLGLSTSDTPTFAGENLTGALTAVPAATTPIMFGNTTAVNTSTAATFATADKKQIDKTGAFTNAAVGDLIIVTGGTGATTGLYRLTTRTSADSVKVDRNIHASGSDIVDGAFSIYKDVITVSPTDGTNGQMISSWSHQNKPLQLGGSSLLGISSETTVAPTGKDIGIQNNLFIGGDGPVYGNIVFPAYSGTTGAQITHSASSIAIYARAGTGKTYNYTGMSTSSAGNISLVGNTVTGPSGEIGTNRQVVTIVRDSASGFYAPALGFYLGQWETSGSNARTDVDIYLTNGTALDTKLMSLRSNKNIVMNPSGGSTSLNYPLVAKSTGTTLTWAEMQNTIVRTTAAVTHTLPAVDATYVGMKFTVQVIGAYTVSIDPNASDRIVLHGTALTDGNKITSSGSTGDFIELYCDSTDGWTTLNSGGTWIDGGA